MKEDAWLKVPENIKSHTLYKKAYNDIRNKKKNVTILVVGPPGTGKSTIGLKICEDLDSSFNATRVVNTVSEFANIVKDPNLKIGSAILFDEIAGSEMAADSRQSLSHTNKILSFISTIYRVKRLIVVYCCPYLMQMDRRIRLIGVTGIIDTYNVDFSEKRTKANLYWVHSNSRTGKVYHTRPRITENGIPKILMTVTFGLPAKKLLDDYAEIKKKFVDSSLTRWGDQLEESNKPAKEKADLNKIYILAREKINELVGEKNKVMSALLLSHFPLSEKQASWLRLALQNDIDQQRIQIRSLTN